MTKFDAIKFNLLLSQHYSLIFIPPFVGTANKRFLRLDLLQIQNLIAFTHNWKRLETEFYRSVQNYSRPKTKAGLRFLYIEHGVNLRSDGLKNTKAC